jgi:hypothetical protein
MEDFRFTVWLGTRATELLSEGSMWIDLLLPYGPMFGVDLTSFKIAPISRPPKEKKNG